MSFYRIYTGFGGEHLLDEQRFKIIIYMYVKHNLHQTCMKKKGSFLCRHCYYYYFYLFINLLECLTKGVIFLDETIPKDEWYRFKPAVRQDSYLAACKKPTIIGEIVTPI